MPMAAAGAQSLIHGGPGVQGGMGGMGGGSSAGNHMLSGNGQGGVLDPQVSTQVALFRQPNAVHLRALPLLPACNPCHYVCRRLTCPAHAALPPPCSSLRACPTACHMAMAACTAFSAPVA